MHAPSLDSNHPLTAAAGLRHMSTSDVVTVRKTYHGAFKDTASRRYFLADVQLGSLRDTLQQTVQLLYFCTRAWARPNYDYVVDGGAAFCFVDKPDSVPNSWTNILVRILSIPLLLVHIPSQTALQKKRNKEVESAWKAAKKEHIGDAAADALYISGLGTAPSAQKRGYAGMLLQKVLDHADAEGRAVTLLTLPENLAWYTRRGFEALGTATAGSDDAAWRATNGPVVWTLMIRHPQSAAPTRTAGSTLRKTE